MVTSNECKDTVKDLYADIKLRVMWRVFLPTVIVFASIITLIGPVIWSNAAKAGATAIKLEGYKESSRAACKASEKREDERYASLVAQIKSLTAKIDRLIENGWSLQDPGCTCKLKRESI